MLAIVTASRGQDAQIPVEPGAMTKNPAFAKVRVDQRLGAQIPLDTEFTDEDGKKVKIGDFFGKRPVLIMPIFYRCTGVCAIEMESIIASLKRTKDVQIGKDLEVIAVDINPRETPELARNKRIQVVNEYGNRATLPNWHFLTGPTSQVTKVTNAIGFYFNDDAKADWVDHPSGVVIATPKGIVSRYMLGMTYEDAVLRQAVGIANQEEVGKASTELFFGCIHVDSATGKRTLVIENVLKVLAAFTIIGIITFIAGFSLFKKKDASQPGDNA